MPCTPSPPKATRKPYTKATAPLPTAELDTWDLFLNHGNRADSTSASNTKGRKEETVEELSEVKPASKKSRPTKGSYDKILLVSLVLKVSMIRNCLAQCLTSTRP
jgi:hypothetical protein